MLERPTRDKHKLIKYIRKLRRQELYNIGTKRGESSWTFCRWTSSSPLVKKALSQSAQNLQPELWPNWQNGYLLKQRVDKMKWTVQISVRVNQCICFPSNFFRFPLPARLQWVEPAGGGSGKRKMFDRKHICWFTLTLHICLKDTSLPHLQLAPVLVLVSFCHLKKKGNFLLKSRRELTPVCIQA